MGQDAPTTCLGNAWRFRRGKECSENTYKDRGISGDEEAVVLNLPDHEVAGNGMVTDKKLAWARSRDVPRGDGKAFALGRDDGSQISGRSGKHLYDVMW